MPDVSRDDRIYVRLRAHEKALYERTAAEAGLTLSEYVRLCVAAETARKTADPAAITALADMFRQGIDQWIQERVDHELRKRRSKG